MQKLNRKYMSDKYAPIFLCLWSSQNLPPVKIFFSWQSKKELPVVKAKMRISFMFSIWCPSDKCFLCTVLCNNKETKWKGAFHKVRQHFFQYFWHLCPLPYVSTFSSIFGPSPLKSADVLYGRPQRVKTTGRAGPL